MFVNLKTYLNILYGTKLGKLFVILLLLLGMGITSLNIYIDNEILTYNYVCSFKNDIWDTWTTDDNYIFKLTNNSIDYSFTDYNNNIINFDLTKIRIVDINIDDQYIYLDVHKYINYFHNKEYIIIEN